MNRPNPIIKAPSQTSNQQTKNDNILDLLDMQEEQIKDVKTPSNILEMLEGSKPKNIEPPKNENLFNNSNDLFSSNKAIPQKNSQSSTNVPFEVENIFCYLIKLTKFINFVACFERNRFRNE